MKMRVLITWSIAAGVFAQTYYATNYVDAENGIYAAPPADWPGSTAVSMNDSLLKSWASGFTNLTYGEGVAEEWKTPERALGPAVGTVDDVVSLGRAGEITLMFPMGISNGSGFDFAVFENSFSDGFLELAYVEVSSDGIHFVRFPCYSDEQNPIPGFYLKMFAQYYFGLAGKYRGGFGTPFDLEELAVAAEAIALGQTDFTPEFIAEFSAAFVHLDLNAVRYVRLVDVVGDGFSLDARGAPIYDPYSTGDISAGFDLEAVGVLHEMTLPAEEIPALKMDWSNDVMQVHCDVSIAWFSAMTLQTSTNLEDWVDVPAGLQTLETNGAMVCVSLSESNAVKDSAYFRLELEAY